MQTAPTEEVDVLAADLAEQAPEDAAAAGERLATHMEVPRCCSALPFRLSLTDSEHEC